MTANCDLPEHPLPPRASALVLALLLALAGTAGSPAVRAQQAGVLAPAEPAVALEWAWIAPATAATGEATERLVDARPAGGAEARLYTGRFRYEGAEAAAALRIVLPVPAGMHYLPGSATGPGVEITYSVDGGRTFGPPEALRVMSADPGTLLRTRRASAAEYTHIQWLLAGEFVPGLAGLVSFRVRPASPVTEWRRLDE